MLEVTTTAAKQNFYIANIQKFSQMQNIFKKVPMDFRNELALCYLDLKANLQKSF